MYSPEGYFYFRKKRLFVNRISYIRWSQARMLLALAEILYILYLPPFPVNFILIRSDRRAFSMSFWNVGKTKR